MWGREVDGGKGRDMGQRQGVRRDVAGEGRAYRH